MGLDRHGRGQKIVGGGLLRRISECNAFVGPTDLDHLYRNEFKECPQQHGFVDGKGNTLRRKENLRSNQEGFH